MPQRYQDLTQADDATDILVLNYGQRFSASVWGTFTGEVAVERSFNGGDWMEVEAFSQPFERDGLAGAEMEMRIRCKSMTSGTAHAGLHSKTTKEVRRSA